MKKLLAFALCCYFSYLSWGLYLSQKHLYAACNYLNKNQEPAAFKELQKAVSKSPFDLVGRYYLASLLNYHKEPVKALRIYEELETKHPFFLLINYQKALIYEKLALYRQAYNELCKATMLYPLDKIVQQEKQKYKIEQRGKIDNERIID